MCVTYLSDGCCFCIWRTAVEDYVVCLTILRLLYTLLLTSSASSSAIIAAAVVQLSVYLECFDDANGGL